MPWGAAATIGAAIITSDMAGGSSPSQQSQAATDESIATSKQAREQGQSLFDYHTQNYRPLEQQAIGLASDAGSQQSQELKAGQAGATVQKSFTNAADARARALTQLGSKPDSGTAGAENIARQNERAYGLSAKTAVADVGRGITSNAIGADNAAAKAAGVGADGALSTQRIADTQAGNIGKAITEIGGVMKNYQPSPAQSTGGYGYDAGGTRGAYDNELSLAAPATSYATDFSGAFRKGGLVKPPRNYAKGGKVTGPGTGTSDSVPVMIDDKTPGALSSGEYVINAKAVKKAGLKKLDRMNLAGLPKGSKMHDGRHLADGGIVDQEAEDDDDETDDTDSKVSSGAYARGGAVARRSFTRPARNENVFALGEPMMRRKSLARLDRGLRLASG
jgi:hypothetical protein